jgi:hypothetical protein
MCAYRKLKEGGREGGRICAAANEIYIPSLYRIVSKTKTVSTCPCVRRGKTEKKQKDKKWVCVCRRNGPREKQEPKKRKNPSLKKMKTKEETKRLKTTKMALRFVLLNPVVVALYSFRS